MNWLDEQLEYWQKKAFDNEKYPQGLSQVEILRPYVEIQNLLFIKLQTAMYKNQTKEESPNQ